MMLKINHEVSGLLRERASRNGTNITTELNDCLRVVLGGKAYVVDRYDWNPSETRWEGSRLIATLDRNKAIDVFVGEVCNMYGYADELPDGNDPEERLLQAVERQATSQDQQDQCYCEFTEIQLDVS